MEYEGLRLLVIIDIKTYYKYYKVLCQGMHKYMCQIFRTYINTYMSMHNAHTY